MDQFQELLKDLQTDPTNLDENLLYNCTRILKNYSEISELELDKDLILLLWQHLDLVLLVSPILDPSNELVDLFTSFLGLVKFSDIVQRYTSEKIIELASSLQVGPIAFKILLEKELDSDSLEYLVTTDFLYKSLENYFNKDISSLAVASNFENLVKIYVDKPGFVEKLLEPSYLKLYRVVRGSKDSTLITRLVDFIVIIGERALVEPKLSKLVPRSVYTYKILDFLGNDETNVNDDPLLVILLIQFYGNLLGMQLSENVLKSVGPTLEEIVLLFSSRNSNIDIQLFYANDLAGLLCKWSWSTNGPIIEKLEQLQSKFQLFKFYNLYLDTSDLDIHLLTNFNMDRVDNPEFVEELTEIHSLFSKRYFSILLNLVNYPKYFEQLTSMGKISLNSISKLSLDMLFRILYELTRKEHSTAWLLQQPQLMNDFILGTTITENEIWNLKKDSLQNLLLDNTPDKLGVWYDDIKATFSLMRNGRNVRDMQPMATVADETG